MIEKIKPVWHKIKLSYILRFVRHLCLVELIFEIVRCCFFFIELWFTIFSMSQQDATHPFCGRYTVKLTQIRLHDSSVLHLLLIGCCRLQGHVTDIRMLFPCM